MRFEENLTLFGWDQTERVVALEFEPGETALVYQREPDGTTRAERIPFRPFLWVTAPLEAAEVKTRPLGGNLAFSFLAECDAWSVFSEWRGSLKAGGAEFFALTDPVQQFLTRSGMTLFKGMDFTELRRIQIGMSEPKTGEAAAVLAVSDNSGWEEAIDASDERAAIARLTEIIQDRDPDVIEGHDLFRSLLPRLSARARKRRLKLEWGRDRSVAKSRASRLQIAEKTINYPKFQVHGRHLVDTFLLAQLWDVGARELESFELGEVARHFDLADKESSSGAVHAARETRALATLFSPSYFTQAQIFPYNYQDIVVRGQATKVDSLFLREYLRQNHSIPSLPEPRSFEGGYTDIFFTGVARNVWHCDVTSLYPSVMLRFDCFPTRDKLGIFRSLLTDLRAFRLDAKARMRESAHDTARQREYREISALNTTFKILINSFYGYLGFAQGHFADFDAAARVTEIGRDLLRRMVDWLKDRRAVVIEIDTDGIYFMPPPGADATDLQRGIEGVLPDGIEIEIDTHYAAMFSYKAKNYALLKDDGELIIRGGALKSRGLERFQRMFLERMIRHLIDAQPEKIRELREEFERKIRGREWPIEYLMKTDTLQDSLDIYRRKIETSARNRSAAYELALRSGRNLQPGDQVSYYITGEKKNVAAYENCKLVTEWNPNTRDENVEYYVAKLGELMKKYDAFLTKEQATHSGQMELI